jgi:hypothetical protein
MRLLITIDAEEDNAWSEGASISTENIHSIPRFQALCEEHGYQPTYLATEPVLLDRTFVDVLNVALADGRAEIGVHLHPWSCGPQAAGASGDRVAHVYPHEIAVADFEAKLTRHVALVQECFARQPLSYRAGRWGFDARQISPLLKCGIRIDCSVTPHVSWRQHLGSPDGSGGPDFRGAPLRPYWLDRNDACLPGGSELLELPMTVLYARGPFASWEGAWQQLDGIRYAPLGKAFAKLGWMPRLFRPLPGATLEDLLRMQHCAARLGLPYVMLMLHSSELMPGGSPYFPDDAAVERLYYKLEGLFLSLRKAGLEGATLSDFAKPYLAGNAQALGAQTRRETA